MTALPQLLQDHAAADEDEQRRPEQLPEADAQDVQAAQQQPAADDDPDEAPEARVRLRAAGDGRPEQNQPDGPEPEEVAGVGNAHRVEPEDDPQPHHEQAEYELR